MDIGTVLRGLYASGIDAKISWDKFNEGISWRIGGNAPDGAKDGGVVCTLEQAAQAMLEAALKHYPDSGYAKRLDGPKPADIIEKVRRVKAVRDATQYPAGEAYEAIEENGTVDKAVAAIRQRQARDAFGIFAEHFKTEG